MRKLAFLLMLGLFVSVAYPVELKVMGGIDFSKSTEPIGGAWPGSSPDPTAEYGLGAIAGGGVEFSLTKHVAIEVDGFYFQKGSAIEVRELGVLNIHEMVRLNELSFPVLLKVCLRPGTSPYLVGGAEYAFVLSKGPKDTDYGLVFGAGFRKKVKRAFLSIEGRYHLGLQDTLTEESILRELRVFVLMMGFSI
jgi:hypothetical protein